MHPTDYVCKHTKVSTSVKEKDMSADAAGPTLLQPHWLYNAHTVAHMPDTQGIHPRETPHSRGSLSRWGRYAPPGTLSESHMAPSRSDSYNTAADYEALLSDAQAGRVVMLGDAGQAACTHTLAFGRPQAIACVEHQPRTLISQKHRHTSVKGTVKGSLTGYWKVSQ
jgi:hypothetical protein